ncbi:MAG: EF-hand domain-containing protein [Verrucomicrobiota bacterium]
MNKIAFCLAVAALGVAVPSMPLSAQETRPANPEIRQNRETGRESQRPEGGEGREGRRPEGRSIRMNPLFMALDTNGDGVISAEEIKNAPAALLKLDKNGDGQLTEDELRPNFARQEGERGRGGSSANVEEIVRRLMEFDKNGDGKITKDELPERMQGLMERGDLNKDGVLTKDEIRKLAEAQAAGNRTVSGGESQRREGGKKHDEDDDDKEHAKRPAANK